MTKRKVLYNVPRGDFGGIYAIVNIENKRVYIGQSQNIPSRARSHDDALSSGEHPIEMLQNDSGKNLVFIVLKKIEPFKSDEALISESLYIYQFKKEKFELYNTLKGNFEENLKETLLRKAI